MKKKHRVVSTIASLAVAVVAIVGLSGFAFFDMLVNDIRGDLVGIAFNVGIYDNYGDSVLQLSGEKVSVQAESTDENGTADSSVIDITIDSHDVKQVGNTVIFAEQGLTPVKDWSLPENVTTDGGLPTIVGRSVNSLKNAIGTSKTVVISSQLGVPLAVYAGNSVGVEVPDDLPKMTKLSIDSKALYIHRANYVILDTDML